MEFWVGFISGVDSCPEEKTSCTPGFEAWIDNPVTNHYTQYGTQIPGGQQGNRIKRINWVAYVARMPEI